MVYLLIFVEIYVVLFKSLDCVCCFWWFLLFLQMYGQALGRPGRPHLGRERAKTNKSSKRAKQKQRKTSDPKNSPNHYAQKLKRIFDNRKTCESPLENGFPGMLFGGIFKPQCRGAETILEPQKYRFPSISQFVGCLFGQWQLGSAKKQDRKRDPHATH